MAPIAAGPIAPAPGAAAVTAAAVRAATPSSVTVRLRLRLFASASIDQKNKNVQALKAALGEAQVEVLDQLPFKSQNRYSAVRVRDGNEERTLVLGACEALVKPVEPHELAEVVRKAWRRAQAP